MSGLLLDTNIVIALINKSRMKVPQRLRDELDEPSHPHSVSVASIWEIAIKSRTGKLELDMAIGQIELALTGSGISVLPITSQQVTALVDPLPATRDPFDRLLLGICAVEDMRLVTTDGPLSEHPLAF